MTTGKHAGAKIASASVKIVSVVVVGLAVIGIGALLGCAIILVGLHDVIAG